MTGIREFRLKTEKLLKIREATENDAQEILSHLKMVSQESDNITLEPGNIDITLEQEVKYLKSVRESENNIYIVGLVNDDIVATANISAGHRPRIRHLGEISISVQKIFWRLGIGRAMMKYLVDWSKSAGIRKLNLDVRTDHHGAIALYEEIGFEKIGVSTRTMLINGEFVDTLIMGLEIDP